MQDNTNTFQEEAIALQGISAAIENLSEQSQRRVLEWALSRVKSGHEYFMHLASAMNTLMDERDVLRRELLEIGEREPEADNTTTP